jgi:hypothetical protein
MPIRILLAALAATALLAACGGDPQKPSAEQQAAVRKAMLAYAACMRKHGVPMQDPTFTADGGVQMTGGGPDQKNVSPATQRAAQKACEHYQKQIKPTGADSPERQAEFRQKALALSRCMRAHGVPNFPDPEFGDNGRIGIKMSKENGVDPHDPAFQRAQRECAQYEPKGAPGS